MGALGEPPEAVPRDAAARSLRLVLPAQAARRAADGAGALHVSDRRTRGGVSRSAVIAREFAVGLRR